MLLLVIAILGWLAFGVVVARFVQQRRELQAVRTTLGVPTDSPLDSAVEQVLEEADDQVAQAEAMQHWLVGALDQSVDAIVVIDRIGREVVRNAAARKFEGARHGDVLAEDALRGTVAAGYRRARRRRVSSSCTGRRVRCSSSGPSRYTPKAKSSVRSRSRTTSPRAVESRACGATSWPTSVTS